MRFGSFLGVALLGLFGAAGCNSAKITDVYLGLDQAGHRRSTCIQATKLDKVTGNHYFVFVEMVSFRDDTLMTPILRERPSEAIIPLAPKEEGQEDELTEFGNYAPGKGEDIILTWEVVGPKVDPQSDDRLPLPVGQYAWEFYLDDHSTYDERLEFVIVEDKAATPNCE